MKPPSNNPDIDQQQLADKLEAILVNRRRREPLIVASPMSTSVQMTYALLPQNSRLREAIKSLPWIGSLAVLAYRRARNIVAPGLHWKQRFRLLPLLGPLALWVYGLVRLNIVRQDIALQLDELRRMHQSYAFSMEARLSRLEAELLNLANDAQASKNTNVDDLDAN